MGKAAVVCVFFLPAAFAFSQNFEYVDFFRDLNDTINNYDFENYKIGGEGLLFVPSIYLSRRWQTYASFGVMVNNPFIEKSDYENENIPDEHQVTTIFKAAFVLKRKKTNVLLYFDYHSDYSWGISLKLRF
jgi:hypothetical protein